MPARDGETGAAPATLSLADAALPAIADAASRCPGTTGRALVPRIVHIGVGGFHRAHLALYTDELATAGGDWGIRGLGMLAERRRDARRARRPGRLCTR